jgi:hypothetical protein
VYVINGPERFIDALQDSGIGISNKLPADWVHLFADKRLSVEELLATLKLKDVSKGLWVSWPKKASKVSTDLTEQTFRDLILPLDWVDTKVAAIDEIWSGLKFVRRRKK